MDKNKVLDQITAIMREYFDDDDLVLTMETTAQDVDEWDSLNHVNIMVAIEQNFGIKFAISEVQELKSVGDLVDLVSKKLGI